jgi:hypothetical protein
VSGWLPPQAPGGQPAPMFEPAPPEPAPEPPMDEVAPWSASAQRPPFARPTPEPGNALATTSLILGMLGLLIIFPSLGFAFVLSLPFSIAAWVTGTLGRKQVTDGVTKAGDGIAHAGIILGIVGIVLGVLGAVVWIVLLASGFDVEQFWNELQRER